MLFGYGGESEIYSVLYSVVWRVPVWSGVWGRDESVFGDWSISLSHVLVDLKRLLFDCTSYRAFLRRLQKCPVGYLICLRLCVLQATSHRTSVPLRGGAAAAGAAYPARAARRGGRPRVASSRRPIFALNLSTGRAFTLCFA